MRTCAPDESQVWRNCLYYSGDKDDATFMAREVGEEFDALFADRILSPVLQQTRRAATTPQVLIALRSLRTQSRRTYA